jgi:hypothetical protein
LLRKLGNGQLHRATNRDLDNAFVLVDPAVSVQRFLRILTNGFQFFQTLFRAQFFVITSARHWPNHRHHDHSKQREEEHNSEPRRQRRA